MMRQNSFKLSILSVVISLSLGACGGDSSPEATPTPEPMLDAADVMLLDTKQWVAISEEFDIANLDVNVAVFSFYENDEEIVVDEEGVYHFSHGLLQLDGTHFTYLPLVGGSAEIDYTVTQGEQTATATVIIPDVAADPLAYQQWHLRNTGQTAYSLSAGLFDGWVQFLVDDEVPEDEAVIITEDRFALGENSLVAGEDVNVLGAYAQGVTGQGMIAVVADSGLEIRHEDLIDNVLPNRSLNLSLGALDLTDPTNTGELGDHGTSVAGLIAAKGWNGLGGKGVAPDTQLIGMNYLSGGDSQPLSDLLVHGFPGSGISTEENISVFNRSYGITFPTFLSYSEFDEAVEMYPTSLRGGKGALNIKSNGNSFYRGRGDEGSLCIDGGAVDLGLSCFNASAEPSQSHPYYLSVAAVNSDGKHTSYSTAGPNTFISAPAGEFGRFYPAMVTTDSMTCFRGYSGFPYADFLAEEVFETDLNIVELMYPFNYPGNEENASCNYTSTFNGTSSAAPNASGVVSLILSANPELSWRDVRHILANTSTQNDPSDPEVSYDVNGEAFIAHQGWFENAAGYQFNNLYGFGRVNAGAAVTAAMNYSDDRGEQVITEWLGQGSVMDEDTSLNLEVPDNDVLGLEQTIEVTDTLTIEAMQFQFDISNEAMQLGETEVQTTAGLDLAIEVMSPSGTRHVLLTGKQALMYPAFSFDDGDQPSYILKAGVLLSNAFYGEMSEGTWTIRIMDTSDQSFDATDGGENVLGVTRYENNANPSILEGVSLRVFGH